MPTPQLGPAGLCQQARLRRRLLLEGGGVMSCGDGEHRESCLGHGEVTASWSEDQLTPKLIETLRGKTVVMVTLGLYPIVTS